mmetsp:Transcript_6887/g.6038  ORF Transcript_6887/g.6038 Transcript_6887/m.6038 type:complete len:219 (+) Transcript_6887:453-1109(+)
MKKIKKSKFDDYQRRFSHKQNIKRILAEKRKENTSKRRTIKDNIIIKRSEIVNSKRAKRQELKSENAKDLEQREILNHWEHRSKEITKINSLADKYKVQSKREKGMVAKLDKLKEVYMSKKFNKIKLQEDNGDKIHNLQQQETELMKKLQTTFQKVADFTNQSSSFDNFSNSMKSKVKYNKIHLKPLGKTGSRTNVSKYDAFINPTIEHNVNQNGSMA